MMRFESYSGSVISIGSIVTFLFWGMKYGIDSAISLFCSLLNICFRAASSVASRKAMKRGLTSASLDQRVISLRESRVFFYFREFNRSSVIILIRLLPHFHFVLQDNKD